MKNLFKKFNKENKKSDRRGFVVLFAIILSTIILSISLGISQIALKETQFAISGVDANNAFYLADAGVECALFIDYLDPVTGVFSGSGTGSSTPCGNLYFSVNAGFPNSPLQMTNFMIGAPNASRNCATVSVAKTLDTNDGVSTVTDIISMGRSKLVNNSCVPDTGTIERELDVSY